MRERLSGFPFWLVQQYFKPFFSPLKGGNALWSWRIIGGAVELYSSVGFSTSCFEETTKPFLSGIQGQLFIMMGDSMSTFDFTWKIRICSTPTRFGIDQRRSFLSHLAVNFARGLILHRISSKAWTISPHNLLKSIYLLSGVYFVLNSIFQPKVVFCFEIAIARFRPDRTCREVCFHLILNR
ncbi:hypothetical protein CDAR_487901 [Caerostris darwini]|uniref:Uncharacterized protein n=1 Tax=Caerostris darwini TaxID=1538125 RepID=A0AAV4MAH8_9ARAC|nr:hypothetical protein CDAR_487901 [Caerostris darwini]